MKISLEKLQDMHGVLRRILTTPMDFKLAYRMRKIADKLITEIKLIESTRLDLVKKYGDVSDDKGNVKVSDKKYPAFEKDYKAFLATEIEFGADKIPLECFEGIKVSAVELQAIGTLIENAPAAPKKK